MGGSNKAPKTFSPGAMIERAWTRPQSFSGSGADALFGASDAGASFAFGATGTGASSVAGALFGASAIGALFGALGAGASSAGALLVLGTSDVAARSAGSGRGSGGVDRWRWPGAIPAAWRNQFIKEYAIPDAGRDASGGAGGGVCAWTEAPTNSRKERENVTTPTLTISPFPAGAPKGIEDIVTRPDLADRAVFLTLEPEQFILKMAEGSFGSMLAVCGCARKPDFGRF